MSKRKRRIGTCECFFPILSFDPAFGARTDKTTNEITKYCDEKILRWAVTNVPPPRLVGATVAEVEEKALAQAKQVILHAKSAGSGAAQASAVRERLWLIQYWHACEPLTRAYQAAEAGGRSRRRSVDGPGQGRQAGRRPALRHRGRQGAARPPLPHGQHWAEFARACGGTFAFWLVSPNRSGSDRTINRKPDAWWQEVLRQIPRLRSNVPRIAATWQRLAVHVVDRDLEPEKWPLALRRSEPYETGPSVQQILDIMNPAC